uniref:Uncharacterized protein n=1 Tax=Arundo donax TaxID=35708 RepID=A0A0A8ZAG5_ARUDO
MHSAPRCARATMFQAALNREGDHGEGLPVAGGALPQCLTDHGGGGIDQERKTRRCRRRSSAQWLCPLWRLPPGIPLLHRPVPRRGRSARAAWPLGTTPLRWSLS